MSGSDDQKAVPFGPGRVCFAALIAGVYGEGGAHPRCLGEQCSDWEKCLFESCAYDADLRKVRKCLASTHARRRARNSREGA
jgi:hypothetical protein